MIDPIEAGELLADYMAARRGLISEETKVAISGDSHTHDALFETLFEMQFWRTLCLCGVDAVRKAIVEMRKAAPHERS